MHILELWLTTELDSRHTLNRQNNVSCGFERVSRWYLLCHLPNPSLGGTQERAVMGDSGLSS